MARPKPRDVDDASWAVIEPLLPGVERRARHPGRKRRPDRLVFQGILFVLHTGIAREHPPQELRATGNRRLGIDQIGHQRI